MPERNRKTNQCRCGLIHGHNGVPGNEDADRLFRQGSSDNSMFDYDGIFFLVF